MKINWRNIFYGWYTIIVTILMVIFLCLAYTINNERRYWKNKAEEYKLDAIYYEMKANNKQRRIDSLTNFILTYEKEDFYLR